MTTVRFPVMTPLRPLLAFTVAASAAGVAVASDSVRQQLTLQTTLHTMTSLQISSPVLVFDLSGSGTDAVASIDFVASARAEPSSEVLLSVQTDRSVEGAGHSGDSQASLSVGEPPLPIPPGQPVIAQRWIGGGTRSGRLVFALRGAAAGRHVVPVRFSLTAP